MRVHPHHWCLDAHNDVGTSTSLFGCPQWCGYIHITDVWVPTVMQVHLHHWCLGAHSDAGTSTSLMFGCPQWCGYIHITVWVPTVMWVHPHHCLGAHSDAGTSTSLFGCPQWCRYIHVTECFHTDGIVVNIRCITTVFKFINLQIEKLCFVYFISLKISRHLICT